jgi:hypothetical protein
MTLAAATVVDAVAARLVPMVATAGRVYTDRAWPIPDALLPAWTVFAESERVESADVGGDVNQHVLEIVCRAKLKATSGLDDAMHALAATGMALIFALPVPYHLQHTGTDRLMQTSGESRIGEIAISLQATYYAKQSAPETIMS